MFGVPLEELTGRLIDLHEAFGADARPLGEQIRDQPAWRQRFDVLDRFLLARLDRSRGVAGIRYAWRRLTKTAGAVPIGAVCREIGWSNKHLITRFRQQVGLAPKRAARVSRFEHFLRRLAPAQPRSYWLRGHVSCHA